MIGQSSSETDSDFIWAGATDYNEARKFFVSNLYNGKIDRSGICKGVLTEDQINQLMDGKKIDEENDRKVSWQTHESNVSSFMDILSGSNDT